MTLTNTSLYPHAQTKDMGVKVSEVLEGSPNMLITRCPTAGTSEESSCILRTQLQMFLFLVVTLQENWSIMQISHICIRHIGVGSSLYSPSGLATSGCPMLLTQNGLLGYLSKPLIYCNHTWIFKFWLKVLHCVLKVDCRRNRCWCNDLWQNTWELFIFLSGLLLSTRKVSRKHIPYLQLFV